MAMHPVYKSRLHSPPFHGISNIHKRPICAENPFHPGKIIGLTTVYWIHLPI